MTIKLLASASTEDGIIKMINIYFCYSKNYILMWENETHTKAMVWNNKLGKSLDGFRVVHKGARYRFERLK